MLSHRLKKVTYLLRFCNLNSPWMKIGTLVDVYEPSEYDYRLFIAKLDYMFLLASSCHIRAPQRDTNMKPPYIA